MRTVRTLLSIAVATFLLAVGVPGGVGPAAGAARGTSTVSWSPCHRHQGPFECARVEVPLDYGDPQAGTASIALVRLPAGSPSRRIGSLFINPGGPGGSGVDIVIGAGRFLFTPAVRARFDIVGFDPRGINRSTPLRCFDSPDEWGPAMPPFAFPITAKQEAKWQAVDAYLADACANHGNSILDHMATADAARDLDRLRAAVGDDQLTYYGVSYGSFLGSTYANMFPDRVRAVIVDAVLDPIAWTTGVGNESDTVPVSPRLRSDMGAQATLDEFFRLCDAGERCAFAPHSSDRFARMARRLLRHPIQVSDGGDTFRFRYQDLIGITLGALYDSAFWRDLARFLSDLESRTDARAMIDGLAELRRALGGGGGGRYQNFPEGFPGVLCSDSMNPTSYQAWSDQGAIADERFGYFGRLWTWVSSICAVWPGADQDRFLGPFDHRTANPLLIVGNMFDPATRYEGAVKLHHLMRNSFLLTVHGWGHGAIFVSRCVDLAEARYLLQGITPARGKVCQQDDVPFASQAASSAQAERRTELNRSLIPPRFLAR
jgi:pimeloyl-ACP methyl ester carboxylesterase